MNTSWKKEFKEVEAELGETIIECTLTEQEQNTSFYGGYGGVEGKRFTAWTENYVLFPIAYDGAEWVGYAPRNPCDIAMEHQGGH